MRALIAAPATLTLAIFALLTAAAAQPQPPTVAIPDVVTLPPRESVTFRAADGASLTVMNRSAWLAILAYDGTILTIAVRSLTGLASPIVTAPSAALLPSCTTVRARGPGAGSSGMLQCEVQPSIDGRSVPFSVLHGDIIIPGPFEWVELPAGCTDMTLTYPPRTPLLGLAQTVQPYHALDSIWHYDAATQRFVWWSPRVPDEDNPYQEVQTLGEAVTICVSEPATFGQPAANSSPDSPP